MEEYNTIIIGSGISGMTAAIYLKRANVNTLIIEKEIPGGELNKACIIENYPGIEKISGTDLALNTYNQLLKLNPDYYYEEVTNVDILKKEVYTSNKTFKYKHLVIATGRRNRLLGIKNEYQHIGKGLSFCASCDGALYKNQDVVVIGGANSALSEALYLSNICHKVYLVYRSEQLRGENILIDRLLQKNNIEVIYNQNVKEYIIKNDKIIGVKLETKEILANCIFLAIGYLPNSEVINAKKENGYIIVDEHGMTNIPDVYACGDVIKKDLYQIVTSSSEGAIVASNIIKRNSGRV